MAIGGRTHGRTFRVSLFAGHGQAAYYVVAEPDGTKAMAILRAGIQENFDVFEDVGHASEALLAALELKPGEFRKT